MVEGAVVWVIAHTGFVECEENVDAGGGRRGRAVRRAIGMGR